MVLLLKTYFMINFFVLQCKTGYTLFTGQLVRDKDTNH